MAVDYSRLKATLAQAQLQTTNNALYQTILNLIDAVIQGQSEDNAVFELLRAAIAGVSSINLIQVDAQAGPVTLDILNYSGLIEFKDLYGVAAANNITLTGTVEGIVNPVINTNFGFYRVFRGEDSAFHTW